MEGRKNQALAKYNRKRKRRSWDERFQYPQHNCQLSRLSSNSKKFLKREKICEIKKTKKAPGEWFHKIWIVERMGEPFVSRIRRKNYLNLSVIRAETTDILLADLFMERLRPLGHDIALKVHYFRTELCVEMIFLECMAVSFNWFVFMNGLLLNGNGKGASDKCFTKIHSLLTLLQLSNR